MAWPRLISRLIVGDCIEVLIYDIFAAATHIRRYFDSDDISLRLPLWAISGHGAFRSALLVSTTILHVAVAILVGQNIPLSGAF